TVRPAPRRIDPERSLHGVTAAPRRSGQSPRAPARPQPQLQHVRSSPGRAAGEPAMSAKEGEADVKKQHPGKKLNSNSLSVSFSSARKKLGIAKGRKKSVKRRKPSASGRTNGTVDMAALQAARKYVAEVGDVDAA